MGEVGKVTCIVCGKSIDKFDAEEIFTGRVRYKCIECSKEGVAQVKARASVTFPHRHIKRTDKWR